jgi:hypothetical protein
LNYTPYLFYKKRFKSEINSFSIWTQIEALNQLMSSAVASALTEGSEEARQPSFQLPHSFEPETMPELIQVTSASVLLQKKDAFWGFSKVGK